MTLEFENPLLFVSQVIAVGSISSQKFGSFADLIPRFGTFFTNCQLLVKRCALNTPAKEKKNGKDLKRIYACLSKSYI